MSPPGQADSPPQPASRVAPAALGPMIEPLLSVGDVVSNRMRAENAFPNTADPNMLCLPAEREAALSDLDPVHGPQDDWTKPRRRLIEHVKAMKKV